MLVNTERKVQTIILYCFAITYGLSFWSWPVFDPDLGFHLFGGAWILKNQQIPFQDPINAFNATWHDYHWFAQILMFKVYEFAGYKGLQVGLGICQAVLFKIILDCLFLCYRYRASVTAITISFILISFLLKEITSIRPQMLALLILALCLRRLLQKPNKYEVPYLLILTIVSVNIHVYWIFIPLLWLGFRSRSKLKAVHLWGVCFLLGLSGLISPYGLIGPNDFVLKNYALIWDYLLMPPVLKGIINEFKSALLVVPWLLIVLLVLAGKSYNFKRSLLKIEWYLSALVTFILAVKGVKFLGVFAICGLPHTNYSVTRSLRGKLKYLDRSKWILSFLLLGILLRTGYKASTSLLQDPIVEMKKHLPIAACSSLSKVNFPNQDKTIRILTHFNDGGWCSWVLFQKAPHLDFKVTTDGRTQWVPGEHYKKSFELFKARGLWAETLAAWNPDAIVVWKTRALAQFLARTPTAWSLIHEDDNFATFLSLPQT